MREQNLEDGDVQGCGACEPVLGPTSSVPLSKVNRRTNIPLRQSLASPVLRAPCPLQRPLPWGPRPHLRREEEEIEVVVVRGQVLEVRQVRVPVRISPPSLEQQSAPEEPVQWADARSR